MPGDVVCCLLSVVCCRLSRYYGYWNGAEDYFSHVRAPDRCPANFTAGLDYRANMELVTTANNTYSANDLANAVARLINRTSTALKRPRAAERNNPLFIYLPFQSVHSPYEAPEWHVA